MSTRPLYVENSVSVSVSEQNDVMLLNLGLMKIRLDSASRFFLLGEILKQVQDDKSQKFQISLARFQICSFRFPKSEIGNLKQKAVIPLEVLRLFMVSASLRWNYPNRFIGSPHHLWWELSAH